MSADTNPMGPSRSEAVSSPILRGLYRVEDGINVTALVLMAALPVIEILLRLLFSKGIPGVTGYVQHLTLWVGFLGAMLASREGRHLSLATGNLPLPAPWKKASRIASATAATAVSSGLTWAAYQFVKWEMETPTHIGGWLPMWVAESVLPVSFAMITLRFVLSAEGWQARTGALVGVAIAIATGLWMEDYAGQLLAPGMIALLLAALAGAPIFVLLGGLALLLFFADMVPVAAIPVETYRIIVSPAIPTIPLFTLTGYLLAEGQASKRLVRLFTALFGWMPGGLAVAATLVCAFFATFTGASGVTILALGGLLLPVLIQSGYPERFSTGLLTATGSIGLLFPPSLAVILYGVVARVPIPDMFIAGIIPGILMVGIVAIYGVVTGVRSHVPRPPFDRREALAAIWESKWEVLLPVVALGSIFGGFATLAEAAAITVMYALLTQTVIHRDLHPIRDVPKVVVHCSTLVGGVFVILGCAMGLTNYLVDAEVPMAAAEWVKAHIDSKLLFLLALNVFLLLVGCLMDIFSALAVVVPLILPMAAAFDIHPLHLGMIFLINLELGYLTPPVGMNLFLASYRFERPLLEMYRASFPYLLLLGMVVLLVTYFPVLIIGVP